jgi:hypothetical protein
MFGTHDLSSNYDRASAIGLATRTLRIAAVVENNHTELKVGVKYFSGVNAVSRRLNADGVCDL